MARLLVVDDEAQIVTALTRALEREGYDIESSRTGLDAVALTAAGSPDLIVLDLNLPDIDGTEVLRRVRTWSSVPVLVLSGDGEEQRKIEALDEGADDYLEKPFGLGELRARVRALLRRAGATPDSSTVTSDGLVVDLGLKSVSLEGATVRLTPTEWRLLQLFVSQPGKLLTHQYLIGKVWGAGHGEETLQTLRAHLRSLRRKLGDDSKEPRFIRTETRIGYRWVAPVAPAAREAGGTVAGG
ncbi:response regulator transcription factor [Pedococcus sp. 2YAF34]|uniref:response regulator transcription factor n=1 Tax=Pedococcus sp. 2YAF34 TaxID=3233032 RepID=UPI003F978648